MYNAWDDYLHVHMNHVNGGTQFICWIIHIMICVYEY